MSGLRWNKDFALAQVAGDENFLQKLVDMFKDSCRSDYALICKAITDRDGQQIASAAHSIKGAAASLGIEAIREISQILEKAGREGNVNTAAEQLPELEKLLRDLKNI